MTYEVRGVEIDIRRTGTGEAVRVVLRSPGARHGPFYYPSERHARAALAEAEERALAVKRPLSHKVSSFLAWCVIGGMVAACLYAAAIMPFMMLVGLIVFLHYLW